MPDAPTNPEDFFDISSGRYVQLLDEDGRPLVGLPPSLRSIAEFAASIHANAGKLSQDQFEQIIQWIKALKMRDRDSASPPYEFLSVLNELRNSPEQMGLHRRGHCKLWLAKGMAMLLALVIAAAVGFAVAHSWVALGISLVAALGLFIVGEWATVSGIQMFKEQEQRYLWASVRRARTVVEANFAGIFAYLHGTTFGAPGFNEEDSRAAMRAERERLTDALYADPDDYLAL
jgi:hypothetical protein